MFDRIRSAATGGSRYRSLIACWVAAACVVLASAPASAQQSRGAELMPTFGWQWGGTVDYTYSGVAGDVHVNAAPTYGGTISIPVRPGYWGEIGYWYQGSELIARPAGNGIKDFKIFDLATHYLQFSGVRALRPPQGKAMPYVMGGLGTTVFDPGSSPYGDFNTQWLFSMSAGGGVRVTMNDKVSLRLQARLLLPINWVSGGFYFGTGGSGVSVSGGSALPQGDATLGLSFKLGQ